MIDTDIAQIVGDHLIKVVGRENAWIVMYSDGGDTCLITNAERIDTIDWLRRQADLLEARSENFRTTHMASH